MPADIDSLFGDDDYNFDNDPFDNDPIEDSFDDTTVSQSAHDDGFDDMIRQQAARSESSFEGMEDDTDDYLEAEGNSGGGFSLGNFTPIQRLIIISLVLLNILAIGFGVLILTGNFG